MFLGPRVASFRFGAVRRGQQRPGRGRTRPPVSLVHEFTASVGILPIDAFYTGLSLGGAYTLHFNDILAWEAISFHYSGNVDSGLESELADRYSVLPDGEPQLQYLTGTHLVFSPLFGKFTVFNSSIVNVATYLAVGGGACEVRRWLSPPGQHRPWSSIVLRSSGIRKARRSKHLCGR